MHGSIASFLETESKIWRWLQKRVFDRVAGVGVLSSHERENFLHAGCPEKKIFNAKLVVEAHAFQNDPGFRERHCIDVETPILLFSSRFIPTKGLFTVIEACAELKDSGREFILFCLGDGPIRREAEALSDRLGLAQHIRFTGYITEGETATFRANSTVFVFPTYQDEGFPLVILKSLAAGLPIITTRVRAAADYLIDGKNCLWVEPRDPRDLAAKMNQLLDDSKLRESMAESNRRLAQQFTPERVAREYIEVYQLLINRRRG